MTEPMAHPIEYVTLSVGEAQDLKADHRLTLVATRKTIDGEGTIVEYQDDSSYSWGDRYEEVTWRGSTWWRKKVRQSDD